MTTDLNGGPAFPAAALSNEGTIDRQGMTLHDYFMAHAPAEPQPWFQPATPPRPVPRQISADEFEDVNAQQEWEAVQSDTLSRKMVQSPAVLAALAENQALIKAGKAWDEEHKKQRWIQWPAAWADAMLKQRRVSKPLVHDSLDSLLSGAQGRRPLARLEGRPVFEGDTLYDRHGERLTAHSYEKPGFPLLMVPIDNDSDHRSTSWATDTHQDGKQVLFWTNPKDAQ